MADPGRAAGWRQAGGQEPPAGSRGIRELTGTVVNSFNGQPIGRALVTSTDRRFATMTDSNGRFRLRLVPNPAFRADLASSPGTLDLTAQRPGFLPMSRTVLANLEAASPEVTLRLDPESALAGSVYREGDAAARGVTLLLLQRAIVNGEYRWNTVAGQRSAADGSFRFSGLLPGQYTLESGEWTGDPPSPVMLTETTEAYPPAFLGDTAEIGGATRLTLHAGDETRVTLHLQRRPYFPVALPLAQGVAGVQVQVAQPGTPAGYQLGYDPSKQVVQGALPDGDYTILLRSFGPTLRYASLPLHVAGKAVRTAPLTLVEPQPIPVHLRFDWTGHGPQGAMEVSLMLMRNDQGSSSNASTTPDKPDLQLAGAVPGVYTLEVSSSYGYVASARCGAADALHEMLTVTTAGAGCGLDITLRDDAGSLEGKVSTAQGGSLTQGFAFLLPPRNGGEILSADLRPDGSFAFANVPPGKYQVFAGPHFPAALPWREPGGLDRLNGKGVSVTVTPRGTAEVEVPLLDRDAWGGEGPDAP